MLDGSFQVIKSNKHKTPRDIIYLQMLPNPHLKAKCVWIELILKVERISLSFQDTHTLLYNILVALPFS